MTGFPLIEYVGNSVSTNAELLDRLARGESISEGNWLVTDRQTAGRGRQGRTWHDGAGNYMGSTVVSLRTDDPPAPTLALVAGIAVFDTVASILPDQRKAMLKWPNDLMLGAAKVAGILLERVNNHVVVGIGINLKTAPHVEDRETISLADIGVHVARDAVAEALARAVRLQLADWRNEGVAAVIARWIERGPKTDTVLSVRAGGDERLEGAYAGLANDGALMLRMADGRLTTVHAGEVTVVRPREG